MPPMHASWPVMITADPWPDYALLDFGDGEKLERYGAYTLRRPEIQAFGRKSLSEAVWNRVDATFMPKKNLHTDADSGIWHLSRKDMPEKWALRFHNLSFFARLMPFRHTGIFPEQSVHWTWITEQIHKASRRAPGRPIRVLNLFGYTGILSLSAAACGAHVEVTHVDASKKALLWAKENARLSKHETAHIRWLCDDAQKFVARALRRGNRYEAIILDPPTFGRGPRGETWDVFTCLAPFIEAVTQLLSEDALFFLLSTYAMRASSLMGHTLMEPLVRQRKTGHLASGEILLPTENDQRRLSVTHFSRWSASS